MWKIDAAGMKRGHPTPSVVNARSVCLVSLKDLSSFVPSVIVVYLCSNNDIMWQSARHSGRSTVLLNSYAEIKDCTGCVLNALTMAAASGNTCSRMRFKNDMMVALCRM